MSNFKIPAEQISNLPSEKRDDHPFQQIKSLSGSGAISIAFEQFVSTYDISLSAAPTFTLDGSGIVFPTESGYAFSWTGELNLINTTGSALVLAWPAGSKWWGDPFTELPANATHKVTCRLISTANGAWQLCDAGELTA